MKLKEYYEQLKILVETYPEALDFPVITSRDDEGNGFNLVSYSPQLCYYDKEDDSCEFHNDIEQLNSVCLN
jgi:hypothetical protein